MYACYFVYCECISFSAVVYFVYCECISFSVVVYFVYCECISFSAVVFLLCVIYLLIIDIDIGAFKLFVCIVLYKQ